MVFQGKRDPQSGTIIGAAMEVHTLLGQGFLEAVYQEALAHELALRGIPFKREYPIPIRYKNVVLGAPYRADFLCFDDLIVEIKAISSLGGIEEAQLLHYLKATGMRVGLLLNFGAKSLEVRRMHWELNLPSSESL